MPNINESQISIIKNSYQKENSQFELKVQKMDFDGVGTDLELKQPGDGKEKEIEIVAEAKNGQVSGVVKSKMREEEKGGGSWLAGLRQFSPVIYIPCQCLCVYLVVIVYLSI